MAERILFEPASYLDRLRPLDLFSREQPLEIEIGSGDGGFLAQYAAQHPRRNFLGIERLKGRLGKLERLARNRGLQNLRLMRIEAGYFTTYMLPPQSVEAVHIYFPDPWPKKRHHKNRLVQPAYLEALGGALAPEGRVYLRTDNEEYFDHMRDVFAGDPTFFPTETPPELKGFVTDFEREFNARGIPTRYAAYRRTRPD